jgi:ABC-type phosphate/phosphonate transport system substrate-binding protein
MSGEYSPTDPSSPHRKRAGLAVDSQAQQGGDTVGFQMSLAANDQPQLTDLGSGSEVHVKGFAIPLKEAQNHGYAFTFQYESSISGSLFPSPTLPTGCM